MMHELLADCLPEGIYVEGTLCRFQIDGEVTVSAAGGGWILRRYNIQRKVDLLTVRGPWLGLAPPESDDQQRWTLDAGDELLLGSDGLFEHTAIRAKSSDELTMQFAGSHGGKTLFDTVHQALQNSLETRAQIDDITMVSVSRVDASIKVPQSLYGHCLSSL
jgi:serine phosphatase RsbU (regulator of sigma subunit)